MKGLKQLGLVTWIMWLSGQLHAAQEPALPNMVVFIADDLGATDIGPYGNTAARTPHLDELARESMVFRQAFAASPTCAPSRSSLLTGLYPMRHGGHGNHSGVHAGTMSLVHHLTDLGYRVAIAGKLHIGPEDVFPFERIAGTNVVEPGFEKNPGLHYDLNLDPVDNWLAGLDTGKPFALVVADHSPHVVWPEVPAYDAAEVDIPAFHIDTEDTRKARARYYTDVTKMDRNLGILLALLDKHRIAENTVLMFTADQGPQWAFGKWGLYDYGIQVPLLVRWPGRVAPGSTSDVLVSHVDVLPTLIEIAGGNPPTGIDGASFHAILRQSTETRSGVVFASHTGDLQMNRSPMRMLRTQRYKYILNLAPQVRYHTHMDLADDHDGGREYWPSWRRESFRDPHAASVLWRYHNRPKEELYDVLNDPFEQHNLAEDEQYMALMEVFRKEMAAWRKRQGDGETGPEEAVAKPRKPGEPPIAPYVF
ncbi:uncharacterized sulfatase [Parapedobacter luteus]|uniref:Uncharacterized sulfatase n=1 Tax=Parapedobacter luteus TaxID=623280 RepID=A0A1T5AUI5_9SPHI|nr:sulfatase [Parapedobacter luteus]SKB38469.1 uncharacterized sulfatase [Parapedobacter luteus]